MTIDKAIVLLECSANELKETIKETTMHSSAAWQLQLYVDAYETAITALRKQEHNRTSEDCKHGESCKCGADVDCCCDDCSAFEPVTERNGLIVDDLVPEMTLDDAIAHLDDTLSDANRKWSCESCRLEHVQLRAWLSELREIKQTKSDEPLTEKVCCNSVSEHFKSDCCIDECVCVSPMTNGDVIRSMSDMELVRIHYCSCGHCKSQDPTNCDMHDYKDGMTPCEQCYLKWLRKPAEYFGEK